jgi:hypothetical protein
MGRPRRWALLSGLIFVTAAGPLLAQAIPPSQVDSWSGWQDGRDATKVADAPLRSLALPGWGQLRLGQRRAWVYLALEAAGWAFFANRQMAGADLRRDYRDLAWAAARLQAGTRRDGDFAYYERLSKWTRSGSFDSDPDLAGIQPEGDGTAFNGSIWALAQDIYIPPGTNPDPDDREYQQALAYYVGRAYGPDFLWDWSAAPEQRTAFASLIARSDDRFRQATATLGALIANHLISAVDAYVSGASPQHEAPLAVWAEPSGLGTRWSAFFRLGSP